ncbi:hypothetical protein THARTR1_07820 [Trichoderma harzianum]|uniref:Uncharacterized protein n=1 Tax=Trichoderma harzianum TaxID=5544 RepID=A0A2K0U196_TRIHA|nr:hypothetical protein THARTR1_07820 [Trichoderma harzianum]
MAPRSAWPLETAQAANLALAMRSPSLFRMIDSLTSCPVLSTDAWTNPMIYTAYLGATQLTEMLILEGLDLHEYITQWDLDTALLNASYAGSLETVRLLVDKGASVDSGKATRRNPLTQAALGGHAAAVRFFVEDEALAAALDGADVRKWVLNAAAEDSHFDIIELLVRNGTEVDEYTFEKVAGSSKDEAAILECLPFLLDNSPDITKEGALCNAAFWGNWKVFELLLGKGADIKALGSRWGNSLHIACAALDIDQSRIEYLLGLGADPNVQGGDHGIALQAVCYSYSSRDEDACIKVTKLLIALGVDIAAQGGEYGNALNNVCASKGNDGMCWYSMAVCHHGNSDLVPLLLAWGENVHAQGGAFTTALHAACFTRPRERKKGDVEMIRLLLDHGAHIQVPGVSSGSVLHAVASSNKSKYNSLLLRVLELGADINQADERGGTALHYALQNMRFDSKDTKQSRIRLLIEHGADVHLAVGDLGSPLYSICVATTNLSDVYEKDRTVALLLEICPDIDVNAQGGEYGSALQAAAWSGQAESIKRLSEKGAHVHVRGDKYGSALNAAVIMGYWNIVKMLLENGARPDFHWQDEMDEDWLAEVQKEHGRGAVEKYRKFCEVEKRKLYIERTQVTA